MARRLIWTIIITGCLAVLLTHAQDIKKPGYVQRQRPQVYELKLPDILVEKAWITAESWQNDPNRLHLTIHYILFNNSTRPTHCCPTEAGKKIWKAKPHMNMLFSIAVFGRQYPSGRYFRLSNGGNVGTLMKAMEKGEYRANQLVKKGSSWQFKIVADWGNMIREKNEKNNSRTLRWPLFPLKKKIIKRK